MPKNHVRNIYSLFFPSVTMQDIIIYFILYIFIHICHRTHECLSNKNRIKPYIFYTNTCLGYVYVIFMDHIRI